MTDAITVYTIQCQRETGKPPVFDYHDRTELSGEHRFYVSTVYNGKTYTSYGLNKKEARMNVCTQIGKEHIFQSAVSAELRNDASVPDLKLWIENVRSFYYRYGIKELTNDMFYAFIAPSVLGQIAWREALAEQGFKMISYDAYEFLGDRELGAWVASKIFKSTSSSGDLTVELSNLVNNKKLSVLSKELGMVKLLLTVSHISEKVEADLVESTIGAVFHSSGNVVMQKYLSEIFPFDNLSTKSKSAK